MSSSTDCSEPRILEFGPVTALGTGRICKTSQDCHNVWADENGFLARLGSCPGPEPQPCFGICRCAAGAEEGAFEYIAAMPAAGGSVPAGMYEFTLPAGLYAAFPVDGLKDIGKVWGYTGEWLAAHPEWKGFCDGNPEGCGCVEHPSFELYPPGFDGSGPLFVYVPVLAA